MLTPAYFLGLDAGGSKSHAIVATAKGTALGFGAAGPGYCGDGRLADAVPEYAAAIEAALDQAGLAREQIIASGFGLAGYDWPSEATQIEAALDTLGLPGEKRIVNDSIIGLIGGASEGWGVVVAAGAGENCRGRDRNGREARTVGAGWRFGDAGGGGWLVQQAVLAVATAWTGRNAPTLLTELFLDHTGLGEIRALLEGLSERRTQLTHSAAPLLFQAAGLNDLVAIDILKRGGRELGLNAAAVIRRLSLGAEALEVVLVGSIFDGQHPALREALEQHVLEAAPRARFVRPIAPPVVGAALLAMEAGGLHPTAGARKSLNESARQLQIRAAADAQNTSTAVTPNVTNRHLP